MHARLLTGGLSLVEQLCALLSCVWLSSWTRMSGSCGQWGVEINNVRSSKLHADSLTKSLDTEAFRFHRNFVMNLW